MNPGLDALQPYPFERLAEIRQRVTAPDGLELINLSIGEPQHPTPACVHEALIAALDGTARYPATRGVLELRGAIAAWAGRRFSLGAGGLDAEHPEVLQLDSADYPLGVGSRGSPAAARRAAPRRARACPRARRSGCICRAHAIDAGASEPDRRRR